MRPRLTVAAAAAVLLTLTACGSDEPAADCIDAAATGDRIAEGANDIPITPVETKAVQSEDSDVYYVAMTFTLDGVDDEESTGVWTTNDLENGSILSVDALAKQFTDWPDAEQAFDISYPNDGTKAAESCITG